jgi:hypothetical protein
MADGEITEVSEAIKLTQVPHLVTVTEKSDL